MPPPPGSPIPSQPTCKVNPVALQARLAAIKAAPFFKQTLLPTTAYVAVIRVDFSDPVMTKTKADTELFMERMKQYYFENSYGLLTVSATVTNDIFRATNTLASYAKGICSNFSKFAQDSVDLAGRNGVDFSTGAPGGNPFNHIMIYHAGFGAETMSDAGCQTANLWSVFAPTVPVNGLDTDGVRGLLTKNGIFFNGVTIVPENEGQGIDPLGVICHEYGHQLGLPDLYKNSAQSVVGSWSLMDSGIYIGAPSGANPSHLDAWSKQFLGFSNPQVHSPIENGTNFSLDYAPSSRSAFLRIPISGIPGVDGNKEYFLVERRARSLYTGKTYDDALPFGALNEGFLIWHIDDSIAADESRLTDNTVNTGAPHFGIDLVEADGKGIIATTVGKESDPFPGSRGRTLFATPLSDSYSGQQSGVALSGFYGPGLIAKKVFASSAVELTKTINYPNPGGPTYPQKIGAPPNTVTTIVLSASRPPQQFKLTIHDLTGQLIRTVPESDIKSNGNATATNKFVFEYEWDGRNDDGDAVAPGVYLYRFKADDSISKTGRLVIVR